VPAYQDYVHPFFYEQDWQLGNDFFTNACLRRRGVDVDANPQDFFIAAELARQKKAPMYLPRYSGERLPHADYAYHFDSGLLGQFLKSHAEKLGVMHKVGNVTQVQCRENGDIFALQLQSGEVIEGDFFVDCSGFKALLISETLGEAFISYKDNLFNDRAIAMPTALDNSREIPSETTSSALSFGWAWKIPLTNRFGNGYVYASDFISPDEAEKELRKHLGKSAEQSEARHLKMRVGRVERHWRNNCLAIGLSQGFIEPLEATALMLIQFSLEHFISMLEQGQFTPCYQVQFNRRINQMFEGVRDYVVAHYRLNTRQDTEYWRANREHENISDRLASILEVWDRGGDFEAELTRHGDDLMYIRPSWYCLFAGMGRFPRSLVEPVALQENISSVQARNETRRLAQQFHSHRNYLKTIYGKAWVTSSALKTSQN
jgi:hypothetical protein